MHKSIFAFALTASLALLLVGRSVQAQPGEKSLDTIARQDGYDLKWLLPDRAVRLYRPGVVIVIRPGTTMYMVNQRVEFSDTPPTYVNGDMLVSTAFASRLRRLAEYGITQRTLRSYQAAQEPQPANAGPISVNVHPAAGTEALLVSGHAPANTLVTITLLATISPDLPTVVLSRNDLLSDVNGQYQANIPVAPDYMRGSIVRIVATAPGATAAQASITLDAPNAGVKVMSDAPYCPNTLCP